MEDIFRYIDDGREKFIQELVTLLRIPSVSTTGLGMLECANHILALISKVGIRAELFSTDHYPMIFGETPNVSHKKTLLLKSHYDVVDPGPIDHWRNEPFCPVVEDNRLWCRGAGDAKGQLFAVLKAIEAWNKTRGELPVNIKLAILGDDEIGAPSLSYVLEKYGHRMVADAAVVVDASTLDVWGPAIILGARGLQVLELIAYGAKQTSHSGSYGGLIKNPAVILVNALSSMRDSAGRILIRGFYDDVKPYGETERVLLDNLVLNQKEKFATLGIDRFWGDPGFSYFETQQFRPTLNINSLSSGFQGEGWELVVPTKATAKVDINIVPDMDPLNVLSSIRNHLDREGYSEIEIHELRSSSYVNWVQPNDPFVAVVKRAQERVWEKRSVLYPSIGGGGGPQTKNKLGIPHYLMLPLGQPDMNEHSPRENFHLEWFIRGIKVIATLFDEYSKDDRVLRNTK